MFCIFSNDSCFMGWCSVMWWKMWYGTIDWVHESSLTSYCLGRKVEKGETLFLVFSFKIRKVESMWSLWINLMWLNNSFNRIIKLSWCQVSLSFLMWLMIKENVCLCVYGREEGRGNGNRNFDPISLLHVFSFLKIIYWLCYHEAIKPSSPNWLKNLENSP